MKQHHSDPAARSSFLRPEPEIRIDNTSNLVHVGKTEIAAFVTAALKKALPELNVVVHSQDGDLHQHDETLTQGRPPQLAPGTKVVIVDRNSGYVSAEQWPSHEAVYTYPPLSESEKAEPEKPTNESLQ